MNYSYVEPEGFDELVVDNIYVLKNIETELTYRVSFQVAATDATLNQDFQTALTPFDILDFPPTQDRLQVFGGDSALFMEISLMVYLKGKRQYKSLLILLTTHYLLTHVLRHLHLQRYSFWMMIVRRKTYKHAST